MTNTKTTKRALLFSCLSMLLCISMLVGSTFAWFTDTATTGVNTIVAGNLDIALEYSADYSNWEDAEAATDVFSSTMWEPGRVEVVYFKVINNGTLAVEFKVGTNVIQNKTGKNAKGEEIDLAKVLQFGIVEVSAAFANRQAAIDAIETPNDFSNISTGEMVLENKNDAKTFAMVVWMPSTTSNDANHNGTDVPEIQFGVTVLATQRNVEKDSFGADYDENATYPNGPKLDAIVAAPKTAAELHDILTTALKGGSASDTITINLEDDFDLANNWTTVDNSNYSGVNKVVINGNGHKITNLNAPLLSGIFAGTEGSFEINNLTIADSVITGEAAYGVGAFLGGADSTNKLIFDNCHLNNVTVNGTITTSGGVGGFVGGCSTANVEITNCTTTNLTVNSNTSAGALFGLCQSNLTVTGCSFTDTTLISTDNGQWRIGLVGGTLNTNTTVTVTNTTETNTTLTQASATANPLQNNVNGAVSNYFGRIYKTVTINGTEYTATSN